MIRHFVAALFAHALLTTPAWATADTPVPSEADREAAARVAAMSNDSPPDRLIQQLEALKLSEGALYMLAGIQPLVVEQVVNDQTRMVLEYIASLPATELSDLRAGQTVVRTSATWSKREKDRLLGISSSYKLRKHKKIKSIRIGNLSGWSMRFELVGKKDDMSEEFAVAETPEREERAMNRLTSHFGARPPEITSGPGTRLPLQDGSFEKEASLGTLWKLEKAVELGGPFPASDVSLDRNEAIDGHASLRLNSDFNTRYWSQVVQKVPVQPDTSLALRSHVRVKAVIRERDQERRFAFGFVFEDANGIEVGQVLKDLDGGDSGWRDHTVHAMVPPGATTARVMLVCTQSGTVWFDGMSLEVGY